MLSTVLSLYIVPVIYVVVKRLASGRVKPHGEEHELDPAGHDGAPGATETGEVVAVSDSGLAEK